MAKTLYENYASVKDLFNRADDALGMKLSKYCFEGPASDLTKPAFASPRFFCTEWLSCRS